MTNRVKRLDGWAGVHQRRRRIAAAGYQCSKCGQIGTKANRLEVDHIIPLALGGTDDDSNTRVLCQSCHLDATAEQFGKRRKRAIGLDGWPIGE